MNQIKVFPNQLATQTIIEVASSQKMENAKLSVFDVLGQEIITSTFDIDNRIVISRDKLNKGIYFYRILQKDKVFASGKMDVE